VGSANPRKRAGKAVRRMQKGERGDRKKRKIKRNWWCEAPVPARKTRQEEILVKANNAKLEERRGGAERGRKMVGDHRTKGTPETKRDRCKTAR